MTPYGERVATDARRAELVFLSYALIDVLEHGVDSADPDVGEAKALLWLATRMVLQPLHTRTQGKVRRRAIRTFQAVLAMYRREGASVAKVGLLVFYIVQAAAECDYIVLDPDSPFTKAMDMMLPALTEASEVGAVNESARKAAKKALALLHQLGLFVGVEIA